MNRATFKKNLIEGINAFYGLEYAKKKEVWREYLNVETEGKKAYIEDVMMKGFGAAPVKAEGAAGAYDAGGEVYTTRYMFETIVLHFAITQEAEEDGLYGSLIGKYGTAAAAALRHTKAIKGANILNNGFDTNFPGGDGLPLFSASHVVQGGVASNTLATPADLSETSLEDMLIMIDDATDYRGIPIGLESKKLVVASSNRFNAARLLKSAQQADTANNAINAVKDSGMLSSFVVDTRLTDPDAWFITTDCMDGLKHVMRKAVQKSVEGDFESGNMRVKFRERYVNGWSDWHGCYGSSGGGA